MPPDANHSRQAMRYTYAITIRPIHSMTHPFMSASTTSVPATYIGREQAWLKHSLLESYLEKLLMIIGMAAKSRGFVEICYVDCFSGPWGTSDLDSTSIAVSLRTMARCKEKLEELQVRTTMRALYIERDTQAFANLRHYLVSHSPATVEAYCRHGDFVELRDDILTWAGAQAFTFFFIDPKGWKSIGIDNLRPLLVRPRSEFLINFIYDFINRTASMTDWQSDIADFLGVGVDQVRSLDTMSPQDRETRLVDHFRQSLKDAVPRQKHPYYGRTAYVRVLDSQRERAKYHLIYLSSHPRGIIEFMTISQGIEAVQQRVRADRRKNARELATKV
ncbi:three-Cys-motif partner protein TcmP [Xylophilus sp. Kf1]|nr:three-Cys-motif partner protein TcmP [Xylophilus sp. Kf1]